MLGSIRLYTAQLHLTIPYSFTWQQAIFNWIQCGALTSTFLNVIWWFLFSYGFTLWGNVVQPCTPARTLLRLCRWDVAQHLMLGSCYQEKWWDGKKISLFHAHIPSEKILIFLHWDFPPLFLWRRVMKDASVSFSSGSNVMASRCLHHTFQQWALVPMLIQVGYCLQMRGNGGAQAASSQDQVLPVLRSGQASVWLI